MNTKIFELSHGCFVDSINAYCKSFALTNKYMFDCPIDKLRFFCVSTKIGKSVHLWNCFGVFPSIKGDFLQNYEVVPYTSKVQLRLNFDFEGS